MFEVNNVRHPLLFILAEEYLCANIHGKNIFYFSYQANYGNYSHKFTRIERSYGYFAASRTRIKFRREHDETLSRDFVVVNLRRYIDVAKCRE